MQSGTKGTWHLLGWGMQKRADLHRHLDGSLRKSTAMNLANALGVAVPINLYFKPHMDLDTALTHLEFTVKLLQSTERLTRLVI